MTTITLPPTPPLRSDPANFAARGDALMAWFPPGVAQMNAVASEVNANAVQAAADAATATTKAADASNFATIAAGLANYKGEWSTLAGALNIPAAVSHGGVFYALKANAADVTAITPGVSSQWLQVGARALYRLPILQANVGYSSASSLEVIGSLLTYSVGIGGAGPSHFAYGSSLFVAMPGASGANCATSPDGKTWTLRAMPSTAAWSGVGTDGTAFLALVAGGTAVAKSADGVTWSAATALAASVEGNTPPIRVGGLWVVFALGNSTTYYTSTDGTAWTTRAFPISLSSSAEVRLCGTTAWVRNAGGSTTAYTSTDGINWTTQTCPAFNSVAAQPDGSLIGALGLVLQRSTDGVGWSASGMPAAIASGNVPVEVNGVRLWYGSPFLYSIDQGIVTARLPGVVASTTSAYQYTANCSRFGAAIGGKYLYAAGTGSVSLIEPSSSITGMFTNP